ncbi:hypothetical protein AURDEDRAFT_131515, partial [Auricularia subglabra TFB-10046 SS5]
MAGDDGSEELSPDSEERRARELVRGESNQRGAGGGRGAAVQHGAADVQAARELIGQEAERVGNGAEHPRLRASEPPARQRNEEVVDAAAARMLANFAQNRPAVPGNGPGPYRERGSTMDVDSSSDSDENDDGGYTSGHSAHRGPGQRRGNQTQQRVRTDAGRESSNLVERTQPSYRQHRDDNNFQEWASRRLIANMGDALVNISAGGWRGRGGRGRGRPHGHGSRNEQGNLRSKIDDVISGSAKPDFTDREYALMSDKDARDVAQA